MVKMSKICLTTNISIHIFVSTCKQLTQSEPMEFSKNGIFHSKSVVIFFQKKLVENPSLPLSCCNYASVDKLERGTFTIATLHHFSPFLQKTYWNWVNQIPQKILLMKIVDIYTNLFGLARVSEWRSMMLENYTM